jgi:hypothetical protein
VVGTGGAELAHAFAPEVERLVLSDEALPHAMNADIGAVVRAVRPLSKLTNRGQVLAGSRPAIYEAAKKAAVQLENCAARWPQAQRDARHVRQ